MNIFKASPNRGGSGGGKEFCGLQCCDNTGQLRPVPRQRAASVRCLTIALLSSWHSQLTSLGLAAHTNDFSTFWFKMLHRHRSAEELLSQSRHALNLPLCRGPAKFLTPISSSYIETEPRERWWSDRGFTELRTVISITPSCHLFNHPTSTGTMNLQHMKFQKMAMMCTTNFTPKDSILESIHCWVFK